MVAWKFPSFCSITLCPEELAVTRKAVPQHCPWVISSPAPLLFITAGRDEAQRAARQVIPAIGLWGGQEGWGSLQLVRNKCDSAALWLTFNWSSCSILMAPVHLVRLRWTLSSQLDGGGSISGRLQLHLPLLGQHATPELGLKLRYWPARVNPRHWPHAAGGWWLHPALQMAWGVSWVQLG